MQNIIISGDIFRFQSLATITIPTRVRMNILAAVSTGDISDWIMIEGWCHQRVIEIKSDPLAYPLPNSASSVRDCESYDLQEGEDSGTPRKSFFLPRPGNYLASHNSSATPDEIFIWRRVEISPRRAIMFLVFLADITLREHIVNATGSMNRGRPSGSK